jgi:hypothetical protein
MRGVNNGSMNGMPPTGRPASLPGADFIAVEGDKIRAVTGYFDTQVVPTQLGLQILVQPHAIGPFSFGGSIRVQSGKRSKPGAFSITFLEARSPEEMQQVREYSREVAAEMLEMEDFIGFVGATIGQRMLTITAWENEDAPRQLMRDGAHKEAVGAFFGPKLTSGGMTSVWTPARINPMWVRCPACDKMANYDKLEGQCVCGQTLPEPPPYW